MHPEQLRQSELAYIDKTLKALRDELHDARILSDDPENIKHIEDHIEFWRQAKAELLLRTVTK